MGKHSILLRLIFCFVLLALKTSAQTYRGTNAPGVSTNFTLRTASYATNCALKLIGTPAGYSFLYLKHGGIASETNYDFSSKLVGQTNRIHWEFPKGAATDWSVCVATPNGAPSHSFTLTAQTNVATLRTVAVSKPAVFSATGIVPTGKWHYFRIEIPTNGLALNVSVKGTNNYPDVYIQRNQLPSTSSYFKKSTGQINDVLALSDAELTPGIYYLGLYTPSGSMRYNLAVNPAQFSQLNFDPGLTHEGTEIYTHSTSNQATNILLKIRTENPTGGGWRTALTVLKGEADLFLSKGTFPVAVTNQPNQFSSYRRGSDGFVLGPSQFNPGEDWYILVRAKTNTQFTLVSGSAFVLDLGELPSELPSSMKVDVGAEGWRFFKTTIPSNTLAWRMWLKDSTNRTATNTIYIRKAGVPLTVTHDTKQVGQLLVVPPYLTVGQQYFIGVPANPGSKIDLDSRQQEIEDIDFSSTDTNIVVSGFGYVTYRVQAPPEQVAWQITTTPISGNPNLYLRRNSVGNQYNADALSELGSGLTDNITLVPPTLSDGTFFLTVFGTNYSFKLQTGPPIIEDIQYTGLVTNTVKTIPGWRYYRISDLDSQLGQLGWELLLTKFNPGTRIALRRNQAPSIWPYRNGSSSGVVNYYDFFSTAEFLQRPSHQTDVWYIGVYNATTNLGEFVLKTAALGAPTLTRVIGTNQVTFDGAKASRTNLAPSRWEYFRVDVPPGIAGWDVRITNANSSSLKLAIRREALPFTDVSSGIVTPNVRTTFSPNSSTTWPGGQQWAASKDWTKRSYSASGVNEDNRIIAMGMSHPLEPATYYVGVFNAGSTKANFTVATRFVGSGQGQSIPLRDLAFGNGSHSGSLPPREAAYYKVNIPNPVKSWKLKLTMASGEAMMVVTTNGFPTVDSERRVQKLGKEHFVLLPDKDKTTVRPGIYYIAVVGEGLSATNSTRVGTGLCSYEIESLGEAKDHGMGHLTRNNELVINGASEGGESAFYSYSSDLVPGMWVTLENRTGNPMLTLGPSDILPLGWIVPDPGRGSDLYGNQGGNTGSPLTQRLLLASTFDRHQIAVKAFGVNGLYKDATYRLRISPILPPTLAFNNGSQTVVNQDSTEEMRWFKIVVPGDTMGWDIRLTNVTKGSPRLVVCSDFIPVEVGTTSGFNPATDTSWYLRWAATRDWTEKPNSPTGLSEDGRILACGMGRPLNPGVYYAGVKASGVSSYTILSRGIGDGYAIPVRELAFSNGTFTGSLPAREAAYFHVTVPSGATSWKLQLTPATNAEVTLAVLKDTLPNVLASTSGSVVTGTSPPRKTQKNGSEEFLLLPRNNFTELIPGDYYVAVIGEGTGITNNTRIGKGTVSFTLTSSPLPIANLGLVSTNLTTNGTLRGGECGAYQFELPSGLSSFEVRLENRVGNPTMVLRQGTQLPDPGVSNSSIGSDTYGNEGGQTSGNSLSTQLITLINPKAGLYSLVVKARQTNSVYTNATYTLRMNAISTAELAFDGGSVSVTNRPGNTWNFLRVEVPEGALGWDLRLTNVTSGQPKIVVRRELLPSGLSSSPWSGPGQTAVWPTNSQWAANYDWTHRQFSSTGVDENGRLLIAGTGRPLEAGYYYVGILGANSTPVSYTIISRGIGDGFSIPVVDLPFEGGAVTNNNLPTREPTYYRVVVPTNTPSWKLKLKSLAGEAMMIAMCETIPNTDLYNTSQGMGSGRTIQKTGTEHHLVLPSNSQPSIRAGTNYLCVVSEGVNPANNSRLGTGTSSFTLSSFGAAPVLQLGTVSSNDLSQVDTLEGGEIKLYQFEVPTNTTGVEVRLENRIGNPVMTLRSGDALPDPGTGQGSIGSDTYGNEGGWTSTDVGNVLITIPNPTPGTYSVAVKARGSSGTYADASYRLRVRELSAPTLNFSSVSNTNGFTNVVTGTLEDNQRAFYRVEVPEALDGKPLLGWKLELRQSSGIAHVRVRKDLLPRDNATSGTPFATPAAYIVPPYLTNGTWYVEVKGQGPTSFTLTSSPIDLERPVWNMPATDSTNVAPGLTLPVFGDTSIDTNGAALPDQSVFLDQGYQHYYSVGVPADNIGLLRVQLEAVSGNPDLYLRYTGAPTIHHNTSGTSGTIYDRSMTASGTEYANWVPLDGKSEFRLKPGTWTVAVRAAGNANARYRMRFSIGNIQTIPLNATLTNQIVAAGDWRYYRLEMPTAGPLTWQASFGQISGDVWMYVRDTIPPGNGNSSGDYKDWSDDAKNGGPYGDFNTPSNYVFRTPPTRIGETYYLGFRGLNDANFTLTVKTNGAPIAEYPQIEFYTGTVSTTIPAKSQITYRIPVPDEATRLKHTSIHSANVQLFLEQGTLPSKGTSDDWKSATSDSFLNAYLGGWPWVPGKSYFLTVSNNNTISESFSLAMDGKNATTDDDDRDGMLDAWERQYFGNTGQAPTGDFDGDGVSNFLEYVEATNPADKSSVRPRLNTTTTNGVINRDITSTNGYVLNTVVTLTAVPNSGYVFVKWTGSTNGSLNPLPVVMDSTKNIGATFRVPGDDFSIRFPLSGTSSVTATNTAATKESGEPNHGGNSGGKSLWWSWTADISGTTTIDTAGSSFPTLLGVYTGTSVTNLTLITNSVSTTNRAKVIFDAVSGVEYGIVVDGINGASGTIALSLTAPSALRSATVVATPIIVENTSSLVSTPGFQFSFTVEPNQSYVVEVSSDLITWETFATVESGENAVLPLSDPNSPKFNQRFYRIRPLK